MPAPTPIEVAKLHEAQLRRIAEAHSVERSCVAQVMVGRFVRDPRSRKAYKVTEIDVGAGGGVILKGVPPRGKVPIVIGGLSSIEIITEREAVNYRKPTKWIA